MSLTDEQIALRKKGIGASEIAAIAGLLPESYDTSALTLWLDKTGREPLSESDFAAHMEWGHPMEVVIGEWYRGQLPQGHRATDLQTIQTNGGRYLATPDLLVSGPTGQWLAQIKNVGHRVAHKWVDGPPVYVVAQCQWELMVLREELGTRFDRNDVVASIAGNPPQVWRQDWNPEMVEELKKAADQFLFCLTTDTRPAVNGHGSWVDYFAREFPQKNSTPELLDMPPGMVNLLEQYDTARDYEREAISHRKKLRNRLLSELGDAAGFIGEGWRVKRKWSRGTPWVDVRRINSDE